MKLRDGFVSNSSSTSFIVFADRKSIITLPQLPEWIKNNTFEDHELWVLREFYGCDGDWDRCKIDKEILDILLRHYTEDDFYILIDPIWRREDDYYPFHYRDELPDYTADWEWSVVEVDQYGVRSAIDWLEHFGEINHEEWEKRVKEMSIRKRYED